MARNAIESDFRSSKMGASGHFVKKLQKKNVRIDLKWREMRSKVMASGHFVKKFKKNKSCVLIFAEMRSKVIFSHPKWPPAAILRENFQKKKKVVY